MKKYGFIFILLAAFLLTGVTTASATSYTIDFDESVYVSNVSDTFFIDDFASIDSASLSINIKDMASLGWWNFDSVVDINAGSTSMTDISLANTWTTIDLALNSATIASMELTHEAPFSIQGQLVDWQGLGHVFPQQPSKFYLDEATLNVNAFSAPAPVPEPGTALLLGSALLGMAIVWRRKRS